MAYDSKLYIHDLDKKAFGALSAFPKLLKLEEAFSANFDEKKAKYDLLSSAIRLNDNQMPEVYELLPPVCEKLGIEIPELYCVDMGKVINAATGGIRKPYVYVTSELVDRMPPDVIASVLAHECGHIACQHVLYHSLAAHVQQAIDIIPLHKIPIVGSFLSPSLVKTLLFWDRCSELSADRAALLCDGVTEKTIESLLYVHGFGKDINVQEFIKQALDLRDFVDESKANKFIEEMMVSEESHPRLATRVYECYEWSKTDQYKGILDGTYTKEDKETEEEQQVEKTDIIDAEVSVSAKKDDALVELASYDESVDIDKELERVNKELDRYTNHADKIDYAFAIASGLLSGVMDALFIGEMGITDKGIGSSHRQVNNFIERFADARGLKGRHLKDTIGNLEDAFKVAQDNTWSGADIGVSAKNHHLADLAHHPTPLGLASAMVVQFLRVGTFVNKDGEWHFKLVKTEAKDILAILIPAALTGFLNWLVAIAENKYEAATGEEVPGYIHKLAHIAASTPMIIQIVKCANNWFGHLVSDMGGSKQTAGKGMGIPGIFVSLLYEVASLPGFKETGLPKLVNDLYEKQKINLRTEVPLYKSLGKQAIPVLLNELIVRTVFFVRRLAAEMTEHEDIRKVDWGRVVPINNRTVDRMLTVSTMTFTLADTADAAVRAAVESGGNWVVFSGKFVSRFNFVGAGRAALSIVKEVSNEHKESQLIHEKMLLTEAKTLMVMQKLQEYKAVVEERLATYLAEDISAFMEGFDYMNKGLESGDSDLVIKGNVIIQKVMGRESQFTTQKEFDDLMESDDALKL